MPFTRKTIPFLFLSIFTVFQQLAAQDITVQGNAPRVVHEGERFQLTYTVNARSNTPQLILTDAFRLLSGPGSSTSQSAQWINGQMTSSFSLIFTYIIEAVKEGKHTIEPVTVSVNGKNITSNQVVIEVVKGTGRAAQQGRQAQQAPVTNQGSAVQGNDADFFVRVLVDRKNVYQGEAILATLKLYTTLSLSNFEKIDLPKFTGFYKEEITTSSQIQLERENVNGRIYQSGVIAKYLLFPQKSGNIEIDPLTIDAIVSERVRTNDPFDAFFGGNVRQYKVSNSSPRVAINVKPLPEPRPVDFNGGVGQIKLDASISKNELETNDAINLKLKFSGTGNIKFLNNPELTFPTDFEVYDPKKDVNVKATEGGASGVALWDFLIIPRHAGQFNIPAINFSYFDPKTQTYKKLSTGSYDITVKQGKEDVGTQTVQGVFKRDVRDIGSDIRFIASENINLTASENYLFGTPLYLAAFIVPIMIFGIYLVIRKKREQDNADIVRLKNKKAAKNSKNHLKSAKKHIKDNKEAEVYDEVLRAIWQYLADKLGIDQARLSRDAVLQILKERSISQELITKVIKTAETCEIARYAPTSVKIPASEIYEQAVNLLVQLEREIR